MIWICFCILQSDWKRVASKVMSSSYQVLPKPFEEKYPKLPVSFQVSPESEAMRHPIPRQVPPLVSNSGTVGHLFSSSSGFRNDFPLMQPLSRERNVQFSSFVSRSDDDGSLLLLHGSSHSEEQSTMVTNDLNENSSSWSTDALQDLLDFSENAADQNVEAQSLAGVLMSDDRAKRNDWPDWADQFISVDDAMEPNWSEIFSDANAGDAKVEVSSFFHETLRSFCAQLSSSELHCTLWVCLLNIVNFFKKKERENKLVKMTSG